MPNQNKAMEDVLNRQPFQGLWTRSAMRPRRPASTSRFRGLTQNRGAKLCRFSITFRDTSNGFYPQLH